LFITTCIEKQYTWTLNVLFSRKQVSDAYKIKTYVRSNLTCVKETHVALFY